MISRKVWGKHLRWFAGSVLEIILTNVLIPGPAHGRHAGGTPDPALPSPTSSLSPLTDQPAAVADEYAVVNKPKKKAAAVSVANGGQPDSAYAVVDKTKKKLALPAVGAKPKPKPKKGKGKKDVAGSLNISFFNRFLIIIFILDCKYRYSRFKITLLSHQRN